MTNIERITTIFLIFMVLISSCETNKDQNSSENNTGSKVFSIEGHWYLQGSSASFYLEEDSITYDYNNPFIGLYEYHISKSYDGRYLFESRVFDVPPFTNDMSSKYYEELCRECLTNPQKCVWRDWYKRDCVIRNDSIFQINEKGEEEFFLYKIVRNTSDCMTWATTVETGGSFDDIITNNSKNEVLYFTLQRLP